MGQDLFVEGFNSYSGFNGTVASVVTKAAIGISSSERADKRGLFDDYRRDTVPGDFPNSSQINRNSKELKILNKLEDQYNKVQDSRDVAGQTLSSLRDTKGKNKDKTLKEIKAYRDQLTNENNKLIKQGSANVQKQKNDAENKSIAEQIAKARGQNIGGAKRVSQMEIDAFKAAAKKAATPAGAKAAKKKKPPKPKGRKPKGRR